MVVAPAHPAIATLPHRRRLAGCVRHLAAFVLNPAQPRRSLVVGEQQGVEGADGSVAAVVRLQGSPNFGVEITGLDIRECLRRGWAQGHEDGGAEYLDALVSTHGLLLFRNQLPRLTAEELITFSKWFGSGHLHSAHAQHDRSEHFDVFRVSNDPNDGCWEPRGVGTSGFHNDGAFMPAPYSNAVYQIVQVPRNGGETHFASSNYCLGSYARRGPEQHARIAELERIRTVSELTGLEFPLAYNHPATGRLTLLSAGWKGAVRCTYAGTRLLSKKLLSDDDNRRLRRDVQEIMSIEGGTYTHEWRPGDVIVSDNLAVMHKADDTAAGPGLEDRSADGSLPQEDVRVLHRTTVAGTYRLGEGTITDEQARGLNSLLSS
jgi:alpha-ketoglutarate-dependent taurine dioxygenase